MTEGVHPPISTNSFTANGTKYLIHGSLTVRRYEVFDRLQVEMSQNVSLSGFRMEMERAYECLNKSKVADAAVVIRNALEGVARIEQGQPHPVLLLSSLFICKEGENLEDWNETEQLEKIDDWKRGGLEMAFFFKLLRHLGAVYMPAYPAPTETTFHKDAIPGIP